MNIVITCAGKSNRFKKEGINTPKFLLPLGNRTVISNILDTYDDNDNFHLVLTNKQLAQNPSLKSYLKNLKRNIYLNIIKEHNLGPSYSAIQAKTCNSKKDIIISYCDFLIDWDYKKFKRQIYEYDYGITSFKGFHPSSFSGTLYADRDAKFFKEYAKKAINSKKFKKEYGEIYTSLPYTFLIKEKKEILNFEVNKFISLGTPKDYHEYLNWRNFFQLKTNSKNL